MCLLTMILLCAKTLNGQPCTGTTGAASQAKKCFEIVSVLVDACDGNNEGQNEMVRLDVGPNDITVANIGVPKYVTGRVNWGANAQNPFLGFATYTVTTTNKIKQLNQTIASAGNCGLLIAVNGNGKFPHDPKSSSSPQRLSIQVPMISAICKTRCTCCYKSKAIQPDIL